jgi:hypothetical protein
VTYLVSIRLTNPKDLDPVAEAAVGMEDRFQFAVSEHRRAPVQRQPDEVELVFRIEGAAEPEAALAEAREIYDRSRNEAGLAPDPDAIIAVAHWRGA